MFYYMAMSISTENDLFYIILQQELDLKFFDLDINNGQLEQTKFSI